MSRNFAALLAVGLLFGASVGIYDFALPYFLDAHGVSVPKMGLVYAVSAILLVVVRVYAGHLSDVVGRKTMYSVSLALTAFVSAATPLTAALWFQTLLKSAREGSTAVFDSMYQLALHDEDRSKYVDRVGKTRGFQSVAEAFATFGTGFLLARQAYAGSFAASAAVLLIGVVIFLFAYCPRPSNSTTPRRSPSLREVLAFDLPAPLVVLTLSSFIFTVGLSISHCFVMQLFWARRFGVSTPVTGTILMLHRFTIALPLLLVGWVVKKPLKSVFIAFLILEGLSLTASGLIPRFLPATVVWLAHDLIGAGVWVPIQSAFIQKYSREDRRGRDVSKVLALGSLGWIFGPLLAGGIFDRWYGGPFVLSGAIMILSALVLFALKDHDR